jgi:hypothetical protein
MIDKKELRIGNSVMYDNRIFQIAAITDEFPLLNTAEFGIGVVDWNNISPIPITEELLVKCGFQYLNGRTDGELTLDILHYEFDFVEGELVTKSRYEEVYKREKLPHIKSLHQLQNLFYCLCNQELTIEI